MPKFHLPPTWNAVSFGLAFPVTAPAVVFGRSPWWRSYPAARDKGPRAQGTLAAHSFGFGKPLANWTLPGVEELAFAVMSLNCRPLNTSDQHWTALLIPSDHGALLEVAAVTQTFPLAAPVVFAMVS